MKILYVAKHASGGNDDEGAIASALSQLGHEVIRLDERLGRRAPRYTADMLLFHKWDCPIVLEYMNKRMTRVMWYFDLVESPDEPSLLLRDTGRVAWMARILPHVDVGFCTDGDWAAKHRLHHLTQGADGRIAGRHYTGDLNVFYQYLFTGIAQRAGQRRAEFVEEMSKTYGSLFKHVSSGLYRKELAGVIARTGVVLAPWAPVTDRYWSNRVYNAAGFGACVAHPWCEKLLEQYTPEEICYYSSKDELHALLQGPLSDMRVIREYRRKAYARTLASNLYVHRCEALMRKVQEWRG